MRRLSGGKNFKASSAPRGCYESRRFRHGFSRISFLLLELRSALISKVTYAKLGHMLRFIRWFAIGLIIVLGVVTGTVWLRGGAGPQAGAGLGIPGNVEVGGPFTLTDTTGKVVTDASFRGRWMLVYFGYTFCPDVCPTELQAVAASLDQLGPLAVKIVPIFITVDPERDTPAAMADYVKLFDDRLIGLTGTTAEVAAAARAYRVYYAKSAGKDAANYLMDHSSFLYLMGPDGKLRMLLKPGITGAEIAAEIRTKMSAS